MADYQLLTTGTTPEEPSRAKRWYVKHIITGFVCSLILLGGILVGSIWTSTLKTTWTPTHDELSGLPASLTPSSQNGSLLTRDSPSFSSNNGQYTLKLHPSGDVVLYHREQAVWWTMTGDNHGDHRFGFETVKGRTRLAVGINRGDRWDTVWHSDLEPACRDAVIETPSLSLSDEGKLSISGSCDLYIAEKEKQRTLAVILTGLYRTNHVACHSHMSHLIESNPSFTRIDVFAYVLYEKDDLDRGRTVESITQTLRECYGDHLKTVDVVSLTEAEVEYPGGQEAMENTVCGSKLRRLYNQIRTLHLAATQWMAWSIKQGYTHDVILRIRPDTNFTAQPDFWGPEEVGENTLVLPHPQGEHYFYCPQMTGRLAIGTSDQIAYGGAAPMSHWLHMSEGFEQMVQLAGSKTSQAHRSFSGCEELPDGPLEKECPRAAPCSIECLVPWYLEARGVRFHAQWDWDQRLLRWGSVQP